MSDDKNLHIAVIGSGGAAMAAALKAAERGVRITLIKMRDIPRTFSARKNSSASSGAPAMALRARMTVQAIGDELFPYLTMGKASSCVPRHSPGTSSNCPVVRDEQ